MKKLFVLLFVLLVACSMSKPQVVETSMQEAQELPPTPEMLPAETAVALSNATESSTESVRSSGMSESAQTVAISIKDFKFSPVELKIKVGDTVTWTQQDRVMHTATSMSGPESFDSGILKQGESFSFTFTKPGMYEYKCTPHPNMKAKIIVE